MNNPDKEFNGHQSGGRIISLDKDNILLSIGEYRSRYLAQDKNSINGKIVKIEINSGKSEIISMGHRNVQGLHFDDEKKILLITEHGPVGGDEINLIYKDKIKKGEIFNFGWPIASYGEHGSKQLYKKYPLKKSHIKAGFIEPLKSFSPGIGISEIVKINKDKFVLSSLKEKSIYFFELNEYDKIINLKKIKIFERIRDLKFYNGKLYLFLEDTPSIGEIDLRFANLGT